jgi:hypothetical protein
MATERIKAWQCIGCGRIEASAPCLGICEDRPRQFVYADDYDRLEALVRQLASVTPRPGEWERTYGALQQRARELLKGS